MGIGRSSAVLFEVESEELGETEYLTNNRGVAKITVLFRKRLSAPDKCSFFMPNV